MIKKYLLAGLIILLPLALTVMIISFLFDFFTAPFAELVTPLVVYLEKSSGVTIPDWMVPTVAKLLSLLVLCVFILLLGLITQLFLVKTLIHWMNLLITRIPFIKTVYQVSVDVFSALFAIDGKKAFKHPVLFPFPSPPNFAIGFATGEIIPEVEQKLKKRLTPVFSPTAPHPISGFLFLVPSDDVKAIEMNNEEIVKFLVSCGTILPEAQTKKSDEYF